MQLTVISIDIVVPLTANGRAVLYTMLLSRQRPWCLQVKNKQGQWINADPIPGTFVCNIGDMLKVPKPDLVGQTHCKASPNLCLAACYVTG